jgi:hypothetical protein
VSSTVTVSQVGGPAIAEVAPIPAISVASANAVSRCRMNLMIAPWSLPTLI